MTKGPGCSNFAFAFRRKGRGKENDDNTATGQKAADALRAGNGLRGVGKSIEETFDSFNTEERPEPGPRETREERTMTILPQDRSSKRYKNQG